MAYRSTHTGAQIDAAIDGMNSGVIGFATKALMDADLAHDDAQLADVTNDAAPQNNGRYRKSGASGTGSWVASGSVGRRPTGSAAGLTALQGITGSFSGEIVYLEYRTAAGDGGHGEFRWDASDLSTEVAADTEAWIYVAPNADATGASGAWVFNGPRLYHVAGAIRQESSGGGWGYIANSEHDYQAFTGPPEVITAPEDFKLRLPHANGYTRITSVVVGSDETFSQRGILAGVSVGLDESILQASAPLKFRTYGTAAVGDVPSCFGSRVSIAALANGTGYRATVPSLMYSSSDNIQATVRGVDARSSDVRVNLIDDTTFDVVAYSPVSGYVRWTSGTTFAVDTDIAGVTVAWATDRITITHPTIAGTNFAISIGRIDGGYEPRVVSRSSTQIVVKFYDDSGVAQTSPTSAYKFYFNRPEKLPATMPSTQAVYLDCGRARVYWADLYDASGNFWLMGLFECK